MPKAAAVYTLVVLAATSLQSQPVTLARPEGRYTVSGTVVNSVTGEPIRRALVQLSGTTAKVMLTDESGRFEFNEIPSGQSGIMARKPGFYSPSEAAREGAVPQWIEVGPNTGLISLKLIPESVLTGKAVNVSDEPLESVPVAILAPRMIEGRKQWETLGFARTDEDGVFRVANLTPGNYYVRAGPVVGNRFAGLRAANRQFGYGTLYYPAATSRDAATAMELHAGERGQTDFVLKKEPLFHITVTVNGASDEQRPSLQVINSEGDPLPVPMRLAGITSFQFNLPPGEYLLVAVGSRLLTSLADGTPPQQILSATTTVNVASDLDGIQLSLAPAVSIPVVVHRESVRQHSRPVSFPQAMPVSIELRSRDRRLAGESHSPILLGRDAASKIVIPNLAPGKYAVSLRGNGQWYVAQARCGNTDLFTEDLVVPAGAQMPPIEVELRDDGATLNGVVEMRKEKKKPSVLIVPMRAGEMPTVAPVHDNGVYWHEALAPGDYEVIAFEQIENLEYANPAVVSKFDGQAVHVHLQAGQENRVDLPLTRGAQ